VLDKNGTGGDLENRRQSTSKYGHSGGYRSVGARIAPVLPHLSGYDFGNEPGEDILGKQIAMERIMRSSTGLAAGRR